SRFVTVAHRNVVRIALHSRYVLKCLSCKNGYYGKDTNCDKKCSSGCIGETCDTNGTCLCKPDFTGNICDSCVDGKYGVDCSLRCSQGCEENICSLLDGSCNCSSYHTAENNEPTTTDKPNVVAAVVGAVGAVILVVAVVIVVIDLKRRNELCWKKPRDEEQHSEEIPQPVVYATVQKNRHTPVTPQQRESSYGNREQQSHTLFAKYNAETGNTLYEDIASGTGDLNTVQENSKPETRRSVIVETQHVELVMEAETLEDDGLEIDDDDQIAREKATKFEEKGGIYYNNAEKINNRKVAVDNLSNHMMEKTDIETEEEFERVYNCSEKTTTEYMIVQFVLQKFPYGLTRSYADSQKQENIKRNRYKGIYPYDDTRVKLRDCETDYINASFIDGYKKRHAYIAALGPISKQLGDFSPFWQMIWQEKVEKIVMLTNLVEDEKDKCEQYWPDLGTSKIYGKVHVSSQSEDEYAEFTRREYTITKESETRQLHHLQFTCWPDKGVPDDVTGIIDFRQRVLSLPVQFDGPVLVHC
ncbi:PTPRT-like protein, partial [Mya arenaria]